MIPSLIIFQTPRWKLDLTLPHVAELEGSDAEPDSPVMQSQ